MNRSILAGLFVLGLGATAQAQSVPSLWDTLEATPTPAQYYGNGGHDRDGWQRHRRPPPNTGYQPEDTRLQRGGPGLQPEDSRLIPPRQDYGRRGYHRNSYSDIPPPGQGRYTYCLDGRCPD